MNFEFIVTVGDCEQDCRLEDIRAAVEKALTERFTFNHITVQPAEDY